jgi:DNA (cytosine-5)-methyltransferase 1
MTKSNFRVVDLFAGCGGLSLGFENAGFSVVGAFDNWEASNKVYGANFDHPIFNANLENYTQYLDTIEDLKPDFIIGGPPCQDFSHAGKRNEEGGRGDLTIAFANIITSIRPHFFVMENVDRLVKTEKYQKAKKIFEDSGYGLSVILLNANLCGVPQSRKRYFVIGELDGEDNAITPFIEAGIGEKPMTIREYLGEDCSTDYYYRHPRNYSRQGIYSVDEPSPTIRGVNRPIPKTYVVHAKDVTNDLAKVRPFTTLERSYIQTFPKDFKFFGTKSDLEQMIGNAVPVKLAEFVASSIAKYISFNKITKNYILKKDPLRLQSEYIF